MITHHLKMSFISICQDEILFQIQNFVSGAKYLSKIPNFLESSKFKGLQKFQILSKFPNFVDISKFCRKFQILSKIPIAEKCIMTPPPCSIVTPMTLLMYTYRRCF